MRTTQNSVELSVERTALRNRVRSFYRLFNRKAFAKCFSFLDPNLREAGKVDENKYIQSLSAFLEHYGTVSLVITKIELYLGVKTKTGTENFGYPLIVWKDARHVPHMFHERWVKHDDQWFTRVVGLVSPDSNNDEHEKEKAGTPPRLST